jgi:membrane peptidoglycan carboxypeptidase
MLLETKRYTDGAPKTLNLTEPLTTLPRGLKIYTTVNSKMQQYAEDL